MEGGMKGGRKGGREGGREGGWEGGRKGGRVGGREEGIIIKWMPAWECKCLCSWPHQCNLACQPHQQLSNRYRVTHSVHGCKPNSHHAACVQDLLSTFSCCSRVRDGICTFAIACWNTFSHCFFPRTRSSAVTRCVFSISISALYSSRI